MFGLSEVRGCRLSCSPKMSRLPRPQDSKLPGPSVPSTSFTFKMNAGGVKRKFVPDEDTNPPRKRLASIPENSAATAKQPLRDARPGVNLRRPGGPPALTQPKAPALSTTRRPQRATSAPPARAPPVRPTTAAARRPVGRVASGSSVNIPDDRFKSLQDQMSNIEAARAADAARLAEQMESERTKVAELQANHLALSRELAQSKTQEINQRRELGMASEELDQLRKRHANEVMDLEMDLKRKERENRELQEELRMCKSDLERERETVSQLKATISHQSTAQITFTTQITALQSQVTALQTALDICSNQKSQTSLDCERAQKRITELEQEARQHETMRRKLHNMVQELKVGVLTAVSVI